MFKNSVIATLLAIGLLALGCGGPASTSPNTASNANVNANLPSPVAVELDPANMPPGLVAQPANTVGTNTAPIKGTTPTPGIPSPAEIKRGVKPGLTPTPGIPSPEEMRRMLGKPPETNVNTPSMKGNDVPMMKSNRPAMMKSNKPTGGKPPTPKPTP